MWGFNPQYLWYVCVVGSLFHGKQLQIVKFDCVKIPHDLQSFPVIHRKYVTQHNKK